MEVAKYGTPMLIEEDAVAGATTPFTIAGTSVEQNTNILCAVVLTQMVNPGAPCIYSISSGIMDMEAGNSPEQHQNQPCCTSLLLRWLTSTIYPFKGEMPAILNFPMRRWVMNELCIFLTLALGRCPSSRIEETGKLVAGRI